MEEWTMTERHAILTAIRENPDDDTPRLAYADWLEEHGEAERANGLRQSLVEGNSSRPACIDLPPSGDFLLIPTRRGIVELVIRDWAFWREHGDLIWERELPWKVRLTTRPDAREISPPGAIKSDAVSIHANERITLSLLAARWPGIEFELPYPPGIEYPERNRRVQQVRDAMAAGIVSQEEGLRRILHILQTDTSPMMLPSG